MADIKKLLHEIQEVDSEIIKLLHARMRLTRDFYAIEAQSKQFHNELEKKVKDNMTSVASTAGSQANSVNKLYKQIHKHAKSHHRSLRKRIKRALKQK